MEIGNNEFYDFDDENVLESELEDEFGDWDDDFASEYDEKSDNFQNQTEENTEDLIIRMLSSKGISDPGKIKFEGENGEIEEIDWNNLTVDEQFNILNHQDEPETGLDDDEIDLINKIRSARLTPREYEAYLMRQGAANVVKPEEPQYIIDDLTDDELYVYDLQARNEEITEEEALDALEKAKLSVDAFSKQMKGIREEYRKLEDDRNSEQQRQQLALRQQQFNNFSNSIRNSIINFKSIGNLDIELDNDEKDEVAQFLLTTDGAGINHFSKVLNDPEWLVKMAWFALKGEDAFNNITDYFTTEMRQREQASYKKGLEDGAKGSPKSKVVYQPKQNNKPNDRNFYTLDDLD